MKKIFIGISLLSFFLLSCSSPKGKIESAIKEVYGQSITPIKNEDGLNYKLPYTGDKIYNIDDAERILTDKIDKAVNSTQENQTELGRASECFSRITTWNTPTIRVLLDAKRCLENGGNDNEITIIIREK